MSEGRGLTREEYVAINMTPRDVAEPRPTAEAATQVDEMLPGVSDDHAVHREITTILVERDQVGLPEVSVVEERAAELTSARHEREAVEARCQAVIRSRQFDLMTNDEGDVRGRPTRRMTNVSVGMDREEEHADP